jgi:hypothetical protein
MLYSVSALRARREGHVPRVEVDGAPRQDFELQPRVRFERACPAHVVVLGGIAGDWCSHGDGHTVQWYDESEAVATALLWLIVACEGDEQRVAARVYGARVQWARWCKDKYPNMVRLSGRDAEGFRPGLFLGSVTGFKQRMSRLRACGLGDQAAREEAEKQALARLAVEMERVPERKSA